MERRAIDPAKQSLGVLPALPGGYRRSGTRRKPAVSKPPTGSANASIRISTETRRGATPTTRPPPSATSSRGSWLSRRGPWRAFSSRGRLSPLGTRSRVPERYPFWNVGLGPAIRGRRSAARGCLRMSPVTVKLPALLWRAGFNISYCFAPCVARRRGVPILRRPRWRASRTPRRPSGGDQRCPPPRPVLRGRPSW